MKALLKKKHLNQLQQFVSKALHDGFINFASWFQKFQMNIKFFNPDKKKYTNDNFLYNKNVDDLKEATKNAYQP